MSELINQFKAKAVKTDNDSSNVQIEASINLQTSHHKNKHNHHHRNHHKSKKEKKEELDDEEEELEKQSEQDEDKPTKKDETSNETQKILKQAQEALKGTDALEKALKQNNNDLKKKIADNIEIEAPTTKEITKKVHKAKVEVKAQKAAAEKPKVVAKAAVHEKKTAKKVEAPKAAKKSCRKGSYQIGSSDFW
jgi:hypothetical protein